VFAETGVCCAWAVLARSIKAPSPRRSQEEYVLFIAKEGRKEGEKMDKSYGLQERRRTS
jgi:hypothetical protein